VNYFKIFDEQEFECLGNHKLESFEHASAILSTALGDDRNEYYIVGTAYARPEDPEPTKGRILVFRVTDKKLQLVTQQQTKGAVYCLATINGKLVAGINSKVQLYGWQSTAQKKLTPEASCHGSILVLQIKVMKDFILVADLMRSISLLTYNKETNTIEELARDYDSNWMTALDAFSDEVFIGAESSYNLFTLVRNAKAVTDEERARLQSVGHMHIGAFINKFRSGSLVMNLPDEKEGVGRIVPTTLFASRDGMIGVLAPLTKEQYTFLSKLEEALEKAIPGVGELSHQEWRSFNSDKKEEPKKGFIDGDFIETFLDLAPAKAQEVAKAVGIPVAELSRRVEELSRIH
jgi:DNA damage-binding protein 1